MSQPTNITLPSHPHTSISDASSIHSHGTSSPHILTPHGTPPITSSHISTSQPHHAQPHLQLGGRWNPFSETRLQQLLSPFEAGTGWRGGEYDAGARFEKRALSHGAHAGQQVRSGLSMSGIGGREIEEPKKTGGQEKGDLKELARRKSMPEGSGAEGTQTLRRPSLSFFSNLSMSRPSSSSAVHPIHASAIDSPVASRPSSPPSTLATPVSAHHGGIGHTDLKPLTEIPNAELPPAMMRSRSSPVSADAISVPKRNQGTVVEKRHYDPCREPKLLHFM